MFPSFPVCRDQAADSGYLDRFCGYSRVLLHCGRRRDCAAGVYDVGE